MAGFAKILRSIWTDREFIGLGTAEQRLFFLLFSQPDLSNCGVLPYLPRRWARLASDTDLGVILTDLRPLADLGLVVIDRDTEELWVRSYMRIDEGFRVPNVAKSIAGAVEAVQSEPLRERIAAEFASLTRTLREPSPEPLSKGSRNGSGKGGSATRPTTAAVATTATAAAAPDSAPVDNFGCVFDDVRAAAAAAAYIDHRVAMVRPGNVRGFRRTVEATLVDEFGNLVSAYLAADPTATVADLCRDVFALPAISACVPTVHPDPDCEFCNGSGLVRTDPHDDDVVGTYADCACLTQPKEIPA